MTFKKNTIMFAAPDYPEMEIEAKKYIKSMNLTAKNVKLVRSDGQILVKAITDFE